ncbi:hypothetical protein [Mesorhizobium sp. M0118]|uniref:hypothetical protein n=1 Tax=Mesorhizobium sp. M0118 TaxID=2956884 RepID=UPI003335FA30
MSQHDDGLRQAFDNLLDDRDHLFTLLDTIDWDAQLDAIQDVLGRNRAAADAVASNIKALEEGVRTYRGRYQDHAVDGHVDAMYRSSYSDAAVSLSAVGMVVPMLESVLSQSFKSLGAMYSAKRMSPPHHQRWQRAGEHVHRWNCQWYFGSSGPRTDIISGIKQLSEATGLANWLEPGTTDWIAAMLSYRNRVFHGGFEWSIDQREQFETLIAERNWDRFFQSARTNDNPWIFYIRDEIIDDMPRRMASILDSLGRFAKNLPFELVCQT